MFVLLIITFVSSKMNPERLSKLQSQVRIGGKGSARRKKKIVRKVTTTDDKKIQSSLKKLGVNGISGIEEVRLQLCYLSNFKGCENRKELWRVVCILNVHMIMSKKHICYTF